MWFYSAAFVSWHNSSPSNVRTASIGHCKLVQYIFPKLVHKKKQSHHTQRILPHDTYVVFKCWVLCSNVQKVPFDKCPQCFSDMKVSRPVVIPRTQGHLLGQRGKLENMTFVCGTVTSRGCAVCDYCRGVKREHSVLSSSQLLCQSGSSTESKGGETRTCGRWWRPRDPL